MKIRSLLSFIVILQIGINAGIMPVDNNTVCLWRFNETSGNIIADFSTNAFNATKTGGSWTEGFDSNSLSLNYNEYATVTNNVNIQYFNQITIEAWVYFTAANINSVNHATIIGKGDAVPAGGYHLIVSHATGGYNLGFFVESDTGESSMGGISSPTIYSFNRWLYIAGVYDGDSLYFYVNGSRTASSKCNLGQIGTTVGDLYINRHTWSNGANAASRLQGKFDEIRISNIARTQSEIKAIWDAANYQPISFYSFSGNANNVVGSDNNGTVSGATLVADRFGNTNSAYSFNGTSSYIGFGSSMALGLPYEAFTVAFWYKASGTSPLFGDYHGTSSGGDGNFAVGIGIDNNPVHTSLSSYLTSMARCSPPLSGDALLFVDDTIAIDSQWHFVTYQMDGIGTMKVTRDQSKTWTTLYNASLNYSNNPVWQAGRHYFAGSYNYYKGLIDDIYIYKRALSSSEIDSLYSLGGWPLSINNPPQFISTAPSTATEDSLYTYSITAVDVDIDDIVTLSLDTFPTGMTISGNVISWTPVNSQVGNNRVVIRATDNHGAFTRQSYTVSVLNTNDPPVITSTPPTAATQNMQYSYQIVAIDVDVGDALTYSLATNPTGMTVSSTGLVTWTPNSSQVSTHNVKVYVRDASMAADSQSWTITVTNVNDAPEITTLSLDTAYEDIAYIDTLKAVDPDGNAVFWFLLEGPDSLTVNLTTGVISWTPRYEHAGNNTVKVRATDGILNDTATFSIYVVTENRPPRITTVFPDTLQQGNLYIIPLSAIDREGDLVSWTIVNMPANMSRIDTNLVWAPTSAQVGEDSVVIIASDGNGSDTLIARYVVLPTTGNERSVPTPTVFSLSATPNPFNPTVNIKVAVPSSVKNPLTLQIYSISGKILKSWTIQGAGYHNVQWNGKDANGSSLPTGLYFARLTGSSSVLQTKLLMVK